MVGLLVVASALAVGLPASLAHATRANTSGLTCVMNDFLNKWGSTSPAWVPTRGAIGGGISNPDNYAHEVTCPLIRSVNPDGTSVSIYTDGANAAGSDLYCAIFVYDYKGHIKTWTSFRDAATIVDHNVGFQNISVYDYIEARCLLNSYKKNDVRGFTVFE